VDTLRICNFIISTNREERREWGKEINFVTSYGLLFMIYGILGSKKIPRRKKIKINTRGTFQNKLTDWSQ